MFVCHSRLYMRCSVNQPSPCLIWIEKGPESQVIDFSSPKWQPCRWGLGFRRECRAWFDPCLWFWYFVAGPHCPRTSSLYICDIPAAKTTLIAEVSCVHMLHFTLFYYITICVHISIYPNEIKRVLPGFWQADSDLKTQWVMTVLLTDEGTAERLGQKKQGQVKWVRGQSCFLSHNSMVFIQLCYWWLVMVLLVS